jgi:hypothetical protein
MPTIEEQAKRACGVSEYEGFHWPHPQQAWNCRCQAIGIALRARQELCAKAVDTKHGGASTTAAITIRSLQ